MATVLLLSSCGRGEERTSDREASAAAPSAASPRSAPDAPRPGSELASADPLSGTVRAGNRDVFGDTPDEYGYYSQRLHFDLASPDPIRRSQVLLERDADASLHLRFSKRDIERVPRIDEVLPLLEAGFDSRDRD